MKLAVALIACLSVVAPASAQDAEAEATAVPEAPDAAALEAPDAAEQEARLRVEAGRLARAQGRLEEALEDFRRAHAIAPTLDRLWSVAEVLEALRRDRELLDAYRAYLELAPESDARAAEVRARAAVLERTLAAPSTSIDEEAAASGAEAPPAREHTVLDEPWFWAVVAVAGAAVIAGLLFGTAGPGVEAPIPGDHGVVVRTLMELP